jgi:hypothetical protein
VTSICRTDARSAAWDTSATNADGDFSCKRCWPCALRHEKSSGAWPRNPSCAFPLLRENNGINGASGKSAKPMSGYARCMPLGHLSREASGCTSETLVRICSRSCKRARRRRRTFWYEWESHGVCRRAKTRSAMSFRRLAPGQARRAVRSRFPPGMVAKHVRRNSSLPLGN